jgi:hypothetical protein
MRLYIYIWLAQQSKDNNVLSVKNDLQVEILYASLGYILSIVDKTSSSSARPIFVMEIIG